MLFFASFEKILEHKPKNWMKKASHGTKEIREKIYICEMSTIMYAVVREVMGI